MKTRICRCGGSYKRSSRLYVPRIILSIFVFLIDAAAAENLPAQTIVVFNTAVPDSEALAKFYAGKRGIADKHVVGLDCPSEEKILREQYDASIAEPLRKIFEERQWWHIHQAADGEKRVQTLGIHSSLSSGACLLKFGPWRQSHWQRRHAGGHWTNGNARWQIFHRNRDAGAAPGRLFQAG
jgi:hypothetical protein